MLDKAKKAGMVLAPHKKQAHRKLEKENLKRAGASADGAAAKSGHEIGIRVVSGADQGGGVQVEGAGDLEGAITDKEEEIDRGGGGDDDDDDDDCHLLRLLLPELLHHIMTFLDGDSVGHCFRTHREMLLHDVVIASIASQLLPPQTKPQSEHEAVERRKEGQGVRSLESESAPKQVVLSGEEQLFRGLCYRTYLTQSRHKVVQPERWGGWRQMYLRRPRVRTNGYYCFVKEWLKNVSRFDSFDAETIARDVYSLTSQSFRYFRFFENGKVLYSLTHQPPDKMGRLLRHPQPPTPTAWRASGKDKVAADVFMGTYSMHQSCVYVRVRSHYNTVNFKLELSHGRRGHFCRLVVQHHFSKGLSASARSPATHHPETQDCEFRFLRAYPK